MSSNVDAAALEAITAAEDLLDGAERREARPAVAGAVDREVALGVIAGAVLAMWRTRPSRPRLQTVVIEAPVRRWRRVLVVAAILAVTAGGFAVGFACGVSVEREHQVYPTKPKERACAGTALEPR